MGEGVLGEAGRRDSGLMERRTLFPSEGGGMVVSGGISARTGPEAAVTESRSPSRPPPLAATVAGMMLVCPRNSATKRVRGRR